MLARENYSFKKYQRELANKKKAKQIVARLKSMSKNNIFTEDEQREFRKLVARIVIDKAEVFDKDLTEAFTIQGVDAEDAEGGYIYIVIE